MNRPTFFISSTIYDFHDLRSAIKFYLEEQGCKVLASEFNDFEKPLDKHSYDACLQAIHSADYFVLLIGTRVGGWYDETNRISITQREYREAYQLQIAGKLKLLSFVRSDVLQIKQDRGELEKFLRTTTLNDQERTAITNHPGKFASDADFIAKFIDEVGRNRETKLAVQGKVVPPTGNWIHALTGFRDVIDVLHGQMFSSIPVEEISVRRLLRRELRDFVGQCLVKIKGEVYSPRFSIDQFHEKNPITLEGKLNEYTNVAIAQWDSISIFAFHLLARQLHPVILPQVLSQATFLEFDLASNSFKETPVYEALLYLQDEIRRFNFANTSENLSIIVNHAPKYRGRQISWIQIKTVELASLLHLLDRWSNVLELSTSILRYLEGGILTTTGLRPDSPVQGMQQQLDDEKLTENEISAYIQSN